jgi:hypothetical protein
MVFSVLKYLLKGIRSAIFEKLKTRHTVYNVKLSLCVIKYNDMNTCGGSGGVTLHIRNLVIRCGWAVSFTLRPFGRTSGLKKRGRWTKSKIPVRKVVINHCQKPSCYFFYNKRLSCSAAVILPLCMFVIYVLFILFYGLFNDAVSSSDYIASNTRAERMNTHFNIQNIWLNNLLVYPRLVSENVHR